MRTSFHHQPEAQHPNSSAIHKLVGRLTHLLAQSDVSLRRIDMSGIGAEADMRNRLALIGCASARLI